MTNTIQHYQSLVDQSSSPIWLNALRTQAANAFTGFPTTKNEAWKYLRLTQLREHDFALMPASKVEKSVIASKLLADCYHIVCVNGFFVPALSNLPTLPGFHCTALSEALSKEVIQALIAATDLSQSLLALNTALFQDGIVLTFDKDCKVDLPIQCLFVTDALASDTTSQQRHFVKLESGADVHLIVEHVSLTEQRCFTNSVWHMELAEQASLNHVQVFSDNAIHFDHCLLKQDAHSVYNGLSFIVGSALVRTDLDQYFNGEYARCTVKGLCISAKDQQIDQHLRIRHGKAHCYSEQFFKGIATDKSRLIFNGKVIVEKNAQKTDALQSYKNLLLSLKAEIYTKPELEIYANDVKCAHGATVGQLSDEALFYLKSRGIDDAQQVLIMAFNQELLDQIALPALKTRISALFTMV